MPGGRSEVKTAVERGAPAVLPVGLPWVTKEGGLLKGTTVLGAESSQFSQVHREPCSQLVSHMSPSPVVGV